MDVGLDTLPDDVGELRALLLAERISVALHQAEHAELAAELGAVNLERDRLAGIRP